MTEETDQRRLAELLDELFAGQERVAREEVVRRAVAADLPANLRIRLEGLPEGEYALDEVAEALDVDGAI
jgi:hypothetical protein